MNPALIVSPHLDDAVLSCGQFLAGRPDCTVVTVFAGIPDDPQLLTAYDEKAGFKTSAQAIRKRRQEDKLALAWLRARPEHLEFLDRGYADPALPVVHEAGLALTIADTVISISKRLNPEIIVGPVGINHPDHTVTGSAMLYIASNVDVPVYLYEELPYRITHPEETAQRLTDLADTHHQPKPDFVGDGPLGLKLQALWCYRSQMRLPEFANPAVFTVPERFWRVTT